MPRYKIIFLKKAQIEFDSFEKVTRKRIAKYLEERVSKTPKSFGKQLAGNLSKFWRYRVGDYRIICEIREKELVVIVVELGHRSKIYD